METRDTSDSDASAFDSEFQNFNVGTRVQLRAQRDTGSVEHFSSLIGFVKDEFLMVKTPMVRNTPFAFYDGEQILMRAFTGTRIHSFTSTVMRSFLSPLNYMLLAYPKEIQSSAIRSELRVKVNMLANMAFTAPDGAKASIEVPLANLSLSGAAINCPVPLPVGGQIQMSFAVQSDGMERTIRTRAIVRSINTVAASRSQDTSAYQCGLQFQDLGAEEQTAIRLATYEAILIDRQNIV